MPPCGAGRMVVAEGIRQVLGMGLLGWLVGKLLPEGDSGRWGRRALELVLLCESVRAILGR